MKYLFFDIECSDGYHICSFGYVLVDDKMKIIDKDDIVINPESRFILSPRKSRPKIELAYSDEYFYKHGNFKSQYEEIKKILTRKGQLLFGHSISSDFRFLMYACQRYNLPVFELSGFDTQKIYQIYSNAPHVESLEKIVDELNIQTDFQYHKSSDDAHATFLVAKRICKRHEISLSDLAAKYNSCIVKMGDLTSKPQKESFYDRADKIKQKYSHYKKKRGRIAFSEVFNKFRKDKRLDVVEEIYKNGYEFTTKIKECSIFVKGDGDSVREKYCRQLKESGKRIKLISLDKFFELINVKEDCFD